MEIKFGYSDVRGARRFGDVGLGDDGKAHVITRSFRQWTVHCLKYYSPFVAYRNRIKEQRREIYQGLLAGKETTPSSGGTSPHIGNRRMLLRELSELLPKSKETAEDQADRGPENTPTPARSLIAAERTDNKIPSTQAGTRSCRTSWDDVHGEMDAEKLLNGSELSMANLTGLDQGEKVRFNTILGVEMNRRIEKKITKLRPKWKNAKKGTEDAARKEAAVAFLTYYTCCAYSKGSADSFETQPLRSPSDKFASASLFEGQPKFVSIAAESRMPVPAGFTAELACQMVEKLEFKDSQLVTTDEKLGNMSVAMEFARAGSSDESGDGFQLPKGGLWQKMMRLPCSLFVFRCFAIYPVNSVMRSRRRVSSRGSTCFED